jgi:Glyoxalase superfamily protein
MQKIPSPKEQARRLKAFLATTGLELPHQVSLEAVAISMGFKNWKTMSAQTDKPAPSALQDVIPGPADGKLFEVPVTVNAPMTALITVRSDSYNRALLIAKAYAREVYPRAFTLNTEIPRFYKDFCAPDPVPEPELMTPEPAEGDFDAATADVSNNMGMSGEFSIQSKDGNYLLTAELSPLNPDSSNDNLRSKCTITISLAYGENHAKEGTKITGFTEGYVFGGDDRTRGDHLEELFKGGELLNMLYAR